MKKNFKKLFLILAIVTTALVCFAFSASAKTVAATGQCGDNVYWEYNSTTKELVVSGTGAMADYKNTYGSPFYDSNIESIVIKEGVTTIGVNAFRDCDSLMEVIMGDSVITIGDYAFILCDSLTKVTIPDYVTTIGEYAFRGCYRLAQVNIPEYVTTIGTYALHSCASIIVDKNNQYFSNDEFGVLFNKDKTTLIQYTYGNKKTTYTIPDSVTTIGAYAFCERNSLKEVIIGDNVTTIRNDAFSQCDSLAEVVIGDNVTTIGDRAFNECDSLSKVTIGDGLATISFCAFNQCYNLTEVTFTDSVTTIHPNAFYDCCFLTDVYYGGTEKQWKKINIGFDNEWLTDANIHYKVCTHEKQSVYAQQNATCTSVGYTMGTYCFECEEWLSGHEKIAKIPHSYTKYTSNKNATLLADGTKTALCDYGCGNKKTVTDKGTKLTLGKPSNLKATQTNSLITLTWNKADNATGYSIFYKLPGDMSWRKCVSYTTKTTHTFKNLPAGTAYTFAVQSVGKVNSTTLYGPYITIATATKTVAPIKIDTTQNASQIKLSWTYCAGATGYRIHHKTNSGWKTALSSTKATTHTFKNLKAGAKYTFAVQPYIKTDSGIIWCDYTTVFTSTKTISPIVTATSTSSGKINLSWKSVNGADFYQVYYKVGNGNYKLYKSYSSTQKLTFTKLKSGTEYTFAIRGVIKGSEGDIYGYYSPVKVVVK